MYPDQPMTASSVYGESKGLQSSQLEKLLAGQSETIGLLQENIQRLENRLRPLSVPLPTADGIAVKELAQNNSAIAEAIERNTRRINSLCEKVNFLTESVQV